MSRLLHHPRVSHCSHLLFIFFVVVEANLHVAYISVALSIRLVDVQLFYRNITMFSVDYCGGVV